MKTIKKLKFMMGLIMSLTVIGCDSKYSYTNEIGLEKKVFIFEEKIDINNQVLDSIVRSSILNCQRKLKYSSTFKLIDLRIYQDDSINVSAMTMTGAEKFDKIKYINISLTFSGQNIYGIQSDSYGYFDFAFHEDKLVELIDVTLRIEETINNNPLSYEEKNLIDSTIFIRWNNSLDFLRSRNRYRNTNISFSTCKNNIQSALYLLNEKNSNFSIERDYSIDDSFGIRCDYYYIFNDECLTLEAQSKEELINKLTFIKEYVLVSELKHSKWKVTEKTGSITETYNK